MNEFIELVRKMRAAQKAYFKFRNLSDLRKARPLEEEVDRWVETLSSVERSLAEERERAVADSRQGLLPWEES